MSQVRDFGTFIGGTEEEDFMTIPNSTKKRKWVSSRFFESERTSCLKETTENVSTSTTSHTSFSSSLFVSQKTFNDGMETVGFLKS